MTKPKYSKTQQNDIVSKIADKYYDDCGGFVRRFFPQMADNPKSQWQFDEWAKFGELKDINRYAYVGCTGAGKSTLIVMTCIWLCLTRNDPRIVIITSTGKQSETTIFDAIREYLTKSNLAEFFDIAATTVTLKCNGNKIKYFCFGDENDEKGNALRGIHSTDPVRGISAVFLDEANKFGEWVYRKLTGIMADGNSLWVLSSNGGAAQGGFYLRFSNAAYGFTSRKVTAWDIGMSQERIDAMAANFGGVDSEEYQHMICANFTGSDETAITLAQMEESKARYLRNEPDRNDLHIVMGVDLSGKTSGKSKNCICIRNTTRILKWELLNMNPDELVPVLQNLMVEYNVKHCFYDASGTLGTLFSEVLYKLHESRLEPFYPNGLGAVEHSPFLNKRSEVIFRMVQWIQSNGEVPFTDKLYALFGALENMVQSADTRFGRVGSLGGKIRYTTKEVLERAGDKTTMDMFDALSYTFAAEKSNVSEAVFNIRTTVDNYSAYKTKMLGRNRQKGVDPLKRLGNMNYFAKSQKFF